LIGKEVWSAWCVVRGVSVLDIWVRVTELRIKNEELGIKNEELRMKS